MLNKNAEGFTTNWKKYKKLKENWEVSTRPILLNTYCKAHNMYFDIVEEPCWQCWDSCQEKVGG